MPTYEYKCDACGHQFEEFQSMSEPALEKCPGCKKKKLRRLFGTGAAILFKGSGFYETDYRSEAYKSAAKADQEAATKKTDTNGTAGANGTDGAAKSEAKSPAKKGGAKNSPSAKPSSDD